MKDVPKQTIDLLPLLYGAPGDEGRWAQFIAALTKETGAVQGLFVHHDGRNRHTELAYGFNLEPEWGQAYGEYFQRLNPYLKLDPSLVPEGSIGLLKGLIPDAEVEKTEFYNDYVIP